MGGDDRDPGRQVAQDVAKALAVDPRIDLVGHSSWTLAGRVQVLVIGDRLGVGAVAGDVRAREVLDR
jgi:hypothetical protein